MPQTLLSTPTVPKNENQVLDMIANQPDLFETLNTAFGSGRRKHTGIEELVNELNCTADILKKAWQMASRNEEMKKSADTRPRSTRSGSVEPREIRRSLRSQSIDKTISIAATTIDSTDNSCASSVCGSPRSEENRQQQELQQQQQQKQLQQQQQQQQQRNRRSSRRNLCSISESDINLESAGLPISSTTKSSSTSVVAGQELTQQQQKPKPCPKSKRAASVTANEIEESGKPQLQQQQQQEEGTKQDLTTVKEVVVVKANEDNVSDSSSPDHRHSPDSTNNTTTNAAVATLDEAAQTMRRAPKRTLRSQSYKKYLEIVKETKSALRHSEPGVTTSRTNTTTGTSRTLSLRQPSGTCKLTTSNPEESTRLFFESIGLTVMNFPQHLQATIKAQVSEMVHDMEFQLSNPDEHDLSDKSIVVVS